MKVGLIMRNNGEIEEYVTNRIKAGWKKYETHHEYHEYPLNWKVKFIGQL